MTETQKYLKKYLSPLLGGKVTNFLYDTSDPHDLYMGLIITVGKKEYQVVALSDAEGNGGGHLDIQLTKSSPKKETN